MYIATCIVIIVTKSWSCVQGEIMYYTSVPLLHYYTVKPILTGEKKINLSASILQRESRSKYGRSERALRNSSARKKAICVQSKHSQLKFMTKQ